MLRKAIFKFLVDKISIITHIFEETSSMLGHTSINTINNLQIK